MCITNCSREVSTWSFNNLHMDNRQFKMDKLDKWYFENVFQKTKHSPAPCPARQQLEEAGVCQLVLGGGGLARHSSHLRPLTLLRRDFCPAFTKMCENAQIASQSQFLRCFKMFNIFLSTILERSGVSVLKKVDSQLCRIMLFNIFGIFENIFQ